MPVSCTSGTGCFLGIRGVLRHLFEDLSLTDFVSVAGELGKPLIVPASVLSLDQKPFSELVARRGLELLESHVCNRLYLSTMKPEEVRANRFTTPNPGVPICKIWNWPLPDSSLDFVLYAC